MSFFIGLSRLNQIVAWTLRSNYQTNKSVVCNFLRVRVVVEVAFWVLLQYNKFLPVDSIFFTPKKQNLWHLFWINIFLFLTRAWEVVNTTRQGIYAILFYIRCMTTSNFITTIKWKKVLLAPCVKESATGTPRKKVFLNNANNNEAHRVWGKIMSFWEIKIFWKPHAMLLKWL